jgi:hypothetical protein
LKVCLIHHADQPLLGRLRRDVEMLGDPRKTSCPAWSALSLSLFHLREGNDLEAMRAYGLGLASPERKSSCEASLEAVAAMVHAKLGHVALAAEALQRARDLATKCDGKDFERGKPISPYWFDWAIAELLIKEAGERVGPTPQ